MIPMVGQHVRNGGATAIVEKVRQRGSATHVDLRILTGTWSGCRLTVSPESCEPIEPRRPAPADAA